MARPAKTGLEYFPLDVDIDMDDKIIDLENELGIEGFGLMIKLFAKIYYTGYYLTWTEKDNKRFAHKNNVKVEIVEKLIKTCCEVGIFSNELFDNYGILTSKGIQARYVEATIRRGKVEILKDYLLADVKEYQNVVIVDKN